MEISKLLGDFMLHVGGSIKQEDISLFGVAFVVPTPSFIDVLPLPLGFISYCPFSSSNCIYLLIFACSLSIIANTPILPSNIVGDDRVPFSLKN